MKYHVKSGSSDEESEVIDENGETFYLNKDSNKITEDENKFDFFVNPI